MTMDKGVRKSVSEKPYEGCLPTEHKSACRSGPCLTRLSQSVPTYPVQGIQTVDNIGICSHDNMLGTVHLVGHHNSQVVSVCEAPEQSRYAEQNAGPLCKGCNLRLVAHISEQVCNGVNDEQT